MYFSLIKPREGCERKAAYDWIKKGAYSEHQWLWENAFPSPPETPRDFIFRRRDVEGIPRFYVVSKRLPQLQSDAWSMQHREYTPQLEEGMKFQFDLRANPVITRTQDGKAKRHDVVMEAKQQKLREHNLKEWKDLQENNKPEPYALVRDSCLQWLEARASRFGFTVINNDSLTVDAYQQHRGRKSEKGEIRFSTVDFCGELQVTDTAVFQKTLYDGIGPAKAFGCGLLLIKPA